MRRKYGLTPWNWLNKITTYIYPGGGDLSTKGSVVCLALVTIFASSGLIAAPAMAGEVGTLTGSWLSDVLSVTPAHGDETPAVPAPLRTSSAADPEKGKGPLIPWEGEGDQRSDRVLSPVDLESRVPNAAEEEEAEQPGRIDDGFFSNLPDLLPDEGGGPRTGLGPRVERFIRYFQEAGRDRFEVWLSRSGRYSEMMREILGKYGLPGDLIYLALIESGFSPKAYSVARAAGPWQFIAGTAKRYELRIDWWADERRDYEKSTHAAARYLKDLYGMFESWPLAAAAYNAGENKIQRAVARYKSDDYAELIRYRYLARETKDYVPKMLAALSIARDPEKYGFGNVVYESPLEFEKAVVSGGTDLAALGRIIGVPGESLREWNPELRRFCTPPKQETYEIRIPKGYGLIVDERMDEIRSDAKVTFLHHDVRKGETLASLSEKYGTPVSTLKEINGLRRDSLRRVSRLVIPVTGLSAEDSVPGKEVSPAQLEMAHMKIDEGLRRGQRVRVRRGDTLSGIAKKARVSVKQLARANRLKPGSVLRVGVVLRIPGGRSTNARAASTGARGGGKSLRHTVRRGDTLWGISREHGVSVKKLAEANHLSPGQLLRSGRVLFIPTES